MLIGSMIGDKVQDELEVTLMGLLKQGVQVLQGPEERMHIGIVGNVIAKIGHRRRIDGREPDGVDAEPAQVIELAGDSRQISHAIAIAIEKTAGVDLINHPRLPPGVRLRHGFCYSSSYMFFIRVYHLLFRLSELSKKITSLPERPR